MSFKPSIAGRPHGTHKDPFWAILTIAISSQTSNTGDYGIAKSPRGETRDKMEFSRELPLPRRLLSGDLFLRDKFVSLYCGILPDVHRAAAAVL